MVVPWAKVLTSIPFLFALAALVDFHSLKILRYPYLGFVVFEQSMTTSAFLYVLPNVCILINIYLFFMFSLLGDCFDA